MAKRAVDGDSDEIGDADIEEAIVQLLNQRQPDATICPSEVARALVSSELQWRALMPRIRDVATRLAEGGLLRITRGGVDARVDDRGGPVRLGRPRDPAAV